MTDHDTTSLLLASLGENLRLAADGDTYRAKVAYAEYQTFLAALNHDAALLADLSAGTAEVLLGPDLAAEVTQGSRGEIVVTTDSLTANTHEPEFVLDEDEQFGLFATDAVLAPRTIGHSAQPHTEAELSAPPVPITPLPVTRTSRGAARPGTAGAIGVPIDVKSMLHNNAVATGLNNPSTSHEAAKRVGRVGTMRARLFWLVADAREGMTDYELEQAMLRINREAGKHQSVSSSRNGLMNDGYVSDSGLRRLTSSGSKAIVWTLTPWARERIALGYETHPEPAHSTGA